MWLISFCIPNNLVMRSFVVACAQPSSRLYQRLDKLLLLSEGHTMYYGEPTCPGWSCADSLCCGVCCKECCVTDPMC